MTTIRSKLGIVFAGTIAVAFVAVATVLIAGERSRIADDITQNAMHFAELSSESIAELFDLHYQNQSYAIFQSELANTLKRDVAISRVEILTAEGEALFDSMADAGKKLPPVKDANLLARLKANKLSLAAHGRIVYLPETGHAAAATSAEDPEGRKVIGISEGAEVDTIIYPLADDRRRVVFHLSYEEVRARTLKSIAYLAMLFAFGFAGSLLIATWFSRTLTAPIMALKSGAEEIARGNLGAKITVTSNDETKVLADTFNQMTAQLSTVLDQKIGLERQAKEFEVAREIQASLLPKAVAIPGLEVATHFAPASAVGGDIYDIVSAGPSRQLFYVADVTGHGVPAGIVAALTNAIMTTASAVGEPLIAVLNQANAILHKKTNSSIFVTMLACEWDHMTKKLTYLNAGHNTPIVYRAKNGGSVETTKIGTLGLGMMPKLLPPPEVRDFAVSHGDTVLIFTDGIVEARNSSNQMFGAEMLGEVFLKACRTKATVEEIAQCLRAEFDAFCGDVAPEDDVTFLVLRVKDA